MRGYKGSWNYIAENMPLFIVEKSQQSSFPNKDLISNVYSEAKESIHFLNACILLSFHCSAGKFCMIYFYCRYINKV